MFTLLETHACEGLGTEGYMRSGASVRATDISSNRLKYNPSPNKTVNDAVEIILSIGSSFDLRHASPPCQWYTRGNAPRRGTETKWQQSIPDVRSALEYVGGPYVIENVKDAAWDMKDPITLCGCMFDLNTADDDGITIHMLRPRLFETNWGLKPPRPCNHEGMEWIAGAYGGARRDKYEAKYIRKGGYVPPNKEVVKRLMGVNHNVTWNGLFEGLPPVYTEYIGNEFKRTML